MPSAFTVSHGIGIQVRTRNYIEISIGSKRTLENQRFLGGDLDLSSYVYISARCFGLSKCSGSPDRLQDHFRISTGNGVLQL